MLLKEQANTTQWALKINEVNLVCPWKWTRWKWTIFCLHWFSLLIELCLPVFWLCSILLFSYFSFTFVFYFKLWLFWDGLWWKNFSSIRLFLLTWIYLDIILTFHIFSVVFFWRIFCKYFLYFDMSDFYGWKLFL